jgi:hypothetical protein
MKMNKEKVKNYIINIVIWLVEGSLMLFCSGAWLYYGIIGKNSLAWLCIFVLCATPWVQALIAYKKPEWFPIWAFCID